MVRDGREKFGAFLVIAPRHPERFAVDPIATSDCYSEGERWLYRTMVIRSENMFPLDWET